MIPYLLAALSILIAGVLHWKLPSTFWKATVLSTVVIVGVSLLFIFVFQPNYLGFEEGTAESGNIGSAVLFVLALASFFGFLVSLMVGHFLKTIKNV